MTTPNPTLYSTGELALVLDDMAATLAHRLRAAGPVTLVGVRRRGAPLADQLLERLGSMGRGVGVERLDLSIKRYADDLTLLHPETRLTEDPEHLAIDLTGRTIAVVDDVLYQGFSLQRAVDYLIGKGAREVVSVMLVDRRCALVPIRADIAGITLQVAPGSVVECHVPPFEPTWQVVFVPPVR